VGLAELLIRNQDIAFEIESGNWEGGILDPSSSVIEFWKLFDSVVGFLMVYEIHRSEKVGDRCGCPFVFTVSEELGFQSVCNGSCGQKIAKWNDGRSCEDGLFLRPLELCGTVGSGGNGYHWAAYGFQGPMVTSPNVYCAERLDLTI
jgi:hypothetical protein